ncbi:MAG: GTP cyclohydrolase FolE2 [Luteolibacter sp.]
MMQELSDTQNEQDTRQIPIDRVGVKGLRFPIEVRDKGMKSQATIATVALTVDLAAHLKGTHMSRFVEALQADGNVLDVSSLQRVPRALLDKLVAEKAHVTYQFPYFISKAAPVTGKPGLVDYEVRFEIEVRTDGSSDIVTTVFVPVATLCPCSKAISERGAHNQRGLVTFSVRTLEPVWVEDLIAIAESSASCELFSLLKRPDEKAVTERAFDNPVFVEDLVRNVAAQANAHEAIAWYRVEAENFESIHNHSAYAVIEKSK